MQHEFIPAKKVKQILEESSDCKIIDVREMSEFTHEHIEDSVHAPLSKFDDHHQDINPNHDYFILCKSGNRACKAGDQLAALGFSNFKIIEDGIEGWKKANLPVLKGQSKVWSLERQVRFTAGLMVTVGLGVGYFYHPAGFLFSALIGIGLMFAAVTNTCGMGLMLAKMPWNQ